MQSERCASPVSPAPTFLLHRDMPLSPSHSPLLRHVHTAQELMSMSEVCSACYLMFSSNCTRVLCTLVLFTVSFSVVSVILNGACGLIYLEY
jgi:hypothetical protein